MVPTLIAVAEATIVSRRWVRPRSIRRVWARSRGAELSPTASAVALATLHALDDALPAQLADRPPAE